MKRLWMSPLLKFIWISIWKCRTESILYFIPNDAEDCKHRLGMLLIMESVFFTRYNKCSFPNYYLKLARNEMMIYPWGKIGFKIMMGSVQKLTHAPPLKYEVNRFPMAFHLWLLTSVPALEEVFALLENNHSNNFICARYLRTFIPTYEELEVF